MQKIIDIVVTVFLLVTAASFWLPGGGDYLAMRSGAMPVGEEGIGTHLICFLTSVFSLILFIYRVVKYFTSEEKRRNPSGTIPPGSASFWQNRAAGSGSSAATAMTRTRRPHTSGSWGLPSPCPA